MGFAPTWLRQVSPPPLLHKTTLTTVITVSNLARNFLPYILYDTAINNILYDAKTLL